MEVQPHRKAVIASRLYALVRKEIEWLVTVLEQLQIEK